MAGSPDISCFATEFKRDAQIWKYLLKRSEDRVVLVARLDAGRYAHLILEKRLVARTALPRHVHYNNIRDASVSALVFSVKRRGEAQSI